MIHRDGIIAHDVMDQVLFITIKTRILIMNLMFFAGCGGGSGGGGGGGVAEVNVTGSIRGSGSLSEMSTWLISFTSRDTGVSYVSAIDQAGNYKINGFPLGQQFCGVLLDPQYRLNAVLAHPAPDSAVGNSGSSSTNKKTYQYMSFTSNIMPAMVHSGPTFSLSASEGVTFDTTETTNGGTDGIPSGLTDFRLFGPASSSSSGQDDSFDSQFEGQGGFELATGDYDDDNIPNESEADIDGDGIPNWFDSDDDFDTIPDIFDTDANANSTSDVLEKVSELYYKQYVDYFTVSVTETVQTDGSRLTALQFVLKLAAGMAAPESVAIRGPTDLFNNSTAIAYDSNTGAESLSSWNNKLLDDGLSGDGGAGDGIYAMTVNLATGKTPKVNQVVYGQLVTTIGDDSYYKEFPYIFPPLTRASIYGRFISGVFYLTSTSSGSSSGVPFADTAASPVAQTNFNWGVHIFDGAGIKVYSSKSISAASDGYSFTLPSGVLDSGSAYKFYIIASSTDRIPGYKAWNIKSTTATFTAP